MKKGREVKLCRIDGDACKPGRAFCPMHHRAFECIRRGAESGSTRANPTENHAAFMRIFGDGKSDPGTPSIADKVLVDYVSEHPGGSAKRGTKRGSVCLTTYEHSTGTVKRRTDEKFRAKYDKEAFICAMKTSRNWCDKRAESHWNLLLRDASNYCDEGGPPWSTTHLYIPANLLRMERDGDIIENFEQKAVTDKTKKPLTDQDIIAACARLSSSLASAACRAYF